MLHELSEILPGSIMITGLVIIMMMIIECVNVWTRGRFVNGIKTSGPLQVMICALLGAVPGCMGGFAVVSMYTHGMVSLGALIAMMIASSGDEAFVMLAMIPRQALIITIGLLVLAITVGLVTDKIKLVGGLNSCNTGNYAIHNEEGKGSGGRHFGWKRILLLCSVAIFLSALLTGAFEEGHHHGDEAEVEYLIGGINLLSEDWMNVMFSIFALSVIVMCIAASDHFIEDHLWHHVICGHLLKIFLWTLGTLALITVLLHYVDLSQWISDNTVLMILIAALIGFIPESGPHLIFVSMFAAGIVPAPVLVASCISQDGHSGLPLLAEDRKSFIVAKAVNFGVAAAAGIIMMFFARI